MKQFSILIIAVVLFAGCQNKNQINTEPNIWANAKWIAYEQLEDSMNIVPAVHGSGNELGEKGIKRSVAPMFCTGLIPRPPVHATCHSASRRTTRTGRRPGAMRRSAPVLSDRRERRNLRPAICAWPCARRRSPAPLAPRPAA